MCWLTQVVQLYKNELGDVDLQTFRKKIQDIKLKDFQYKLNTKIIVTKTFLYKINIVQNESCSYCNADLKRYIIFSTAVQQ